MFEPTTGTTTDPERDVKVTPRRLGFVGAGVALVVVVALLLLVIWLVPTDDASAAAGLSSTTATAPVVLTHPEV